MNRVMLTIATWAIVGIMLAMVGCNENLLELPLRAGFSTEVDRDRVMLRVFYVQPKSHNSPNAAANFALFDDLISDAQTFFADDLSSKGYGSKTFHYYKNTDGSADVTTITLPHDEDYYKAFYDEHGYSAVSQEMRDRGFRDVDDGLIEVFFMDVPSNRHCSGGGFDNGGSISLFRHYWNSITMKHELGHAFGLQHDFRDNAYVMSYGSQLNAILSDASAGWVSRHSAFNEGNMIWYVPFESRDIEFNISDVDEDKTSGIFRVTFEMLFPYDADNPYSADYIFDFAVMLDGRTRNVINFSDNVIRKTTGSAILHQVFVETPIPDNISDVAFEFIGPNGHILGFDRRVERIPIHR